MTWPLIPPAYEGRTFGGSRFPDYDDDAFDDFREYGTRERRKTNDADRCPLHGRYLSRPEHEAGACFTCRPDLDRRPLSARRAAKPSGRDGADAVQAAFS